MEDKASLGELRQRYFVDRRWKELADVLEREIPLTADRTERLELYEELGTICIEHLQDAERAFDAFKTVIDLRDDWSEEDALEVFEQILDFAPGFWPAFQRIETVYRNRGNVESFQTLAGRYIDLAGAVVGEPERFLRHQREAARIFEQELGSPESALMVLIASVNVETWQTGILEDIERLCLLTDDWGEAIEKLRDVVGNMTDSPRAGRLHKRIGFWGLRAGRSDDASHHLRAVLRHFPGDRETSDALDRLYRVEGRWEDLLAAVRMQRGEAVDAVHAKELRDQHMKLLQDAADVAGTMEAKGRYLAELGSLYEDELDDRASAVRCWEQALNAETSTLAAARPLIDHYLEKNRWERAAPVLETVIKAAEAKRGLLEERELNVRYLQYAEVLDKVGNEKLALHAYRQAYELDRNNARTLERLGLLLFEADEFDQAYHVFIQLADRHERDVRPEVLVEVLRKAAAIKSHHGDPRTALGLVDRALRINPNDRETLKVAADVAAASGDLDTAMNARRRLVDSEANPTVKFADLVDMGDTWVGEENWERAGQSYANALKLEPNSVSVLRNLLECFQKMDRWREAIGVLERLADQEPARLKRAKLFYTMGIIARDHLNSPERAVKHLDRALDEDTELLKAFEAIDRILTDAKAWKELERAYRRMLHRVSENELGLDVATRKKLDLLLWTSLGEVYRSRLGDLNAAVQAFEAVIGLSPNNEKAQMIIAELYEKTGSNTDGALAQHRKLLAKDPLRAQSYHALYRAFMAQKKFDAAHCVSGVLHFMEKGDYETNEYFQTYLGMNLKLAKASFYPELLDKVYPRAQNRVVNAVMAHLGVALRGTFANNVRDFGVNPKRDRIDENSSQLVFSQIYRYVTKTMALVPPPHLYMRRDHPLGLRILNVQPPALLLGSDVLDSPDDDRETVFRVAKIVAWMRPEHYLAAIGNTPAQLQVMFVSAMDFVLGRKPTAGRDGAAVIKAIKASGSQTQLQLQSLIRTYTQHASGPPDMAEWVSQAEHATSRFGLILCGDLQKAVYGIKREPQAMTMATMEDRIKSLVMYAASERYFEVRKELGLAIG